ncbi:MAG: arginine decarboxylase, pyruvoyl-dependent [Dehalococcoidia bacterium]|nr:arginine decarboxylase, pyruvoyl-dependent [Dehalococcoidia bacterium]
MWNVPSYFWMTAGVAEGGTPLNAFDNALLAAGIGNFNLIRVSSVLPAKVKQAHCRPTQFPEGSLMPTAYQVAESATPGEIIAACVGIGRTPDDYGLIFELAGAMTADEAEQIVRQQIQEAFARRGIELAEMCVRSCQHEVVANGCAVAAVMLW